MSLFKIFPRVCLSSSFTSFTSFTSFAPSAVNLPYRILSQGIRIGIMVLLVCGMGHFAAFAQDDSFGMPPLVDDTSADFPDESVNLVMIEPFRSLEIRASYGIQAVAIIPEGETYGDYDLFI